MDGNANALGNLTRVPKRKKKENGRDLPAMKNYPASLRTDKKGGGRGHAVSHPHLS